MIHATNCLSVYQWISFQRTVHLQLKGRRPTASDVSLHPIVPRPPVLTWHLTYHFFAFLRKSYHRPTTLKKLSYHSLSLSSHRPLTDCGYCFCLFGIKWTANLPPVIFSCRHLGRGSLISSSLARPRLVSGKGKLPA